MTPPDDEHRELLAFLYRAPIALVQTNLDGHIELMTPRAAALLSALLGTAAPSNLFDALVQLVPDLRAQAQSQNRANGLVCDGLRLSVTTPTALTGTQMLSLSMMRSGRQRFTALFTDVTAEVRAADRERVDSAERLALATTTAGIGSFEHVVKDAAWHWSAQARNLHSCPEGAAVLPLNHLRTVLSEADWARFDAWWRAALSGNDSEPLEYPVHRPDGALRWLHCRGRVLRDDAGHVRSLIGVVWDITEHRQLEEAHQARRVAEQASLAKTAFLSRMSHELRTPLNAILGFAELMLMQPDALSWPHREQLGHIRTAGEHLLHLVTDLLDMSAIEAGQLAVSMSRVDALNTARSVLAELGGTLGHRALTLTLNAPEVTSAMVSANPTRLRQVLINLVSNAIKYNRPEGHVELGLQRDGALWWIRVTDTGLGMTTAQMAHLFEPFNRLGREQTHLEGLGLGLVVTRQLVQAMGGDLQVSSQLGVGSTFRFSLITADDGDGDGGDGQTAHRSVNAPPASNGQAGT